MFRLGWAHCHYPRPLIDLMPSSKNPPSERSAPTSRPSRRSSNQDHREDHREDIIHWAQSFRATLATAPGLSPDQLSPAWPKDRDLGSDPLSRPSTGRADFPGRREILEDLSPASRYTRLTSAIISMYREAQALNGDDLLLNANREFSDDWAWSRPQDNPYQADRLQPLVPARLLVHEALSALAISDCLDKESRMVAASPNISLWGRLMLQSITVEHWGQIVFARGTAMPLCRAQSIFPPDERVVILEVFGCPMLADPAAALALSQNEHAMKSWATSLLDGPFGPGTLAAALWPHPVHPDAMITPSVLNMLSCLAGEHLVRSIGGRAHADVMKVISEMVHHELNSWNPLRSVRRPSRPLSPSDTARRLPMVWPGIRCWVGTLSDYAHTPDFLSRTTSMKPAMRTLAESWWTTCIGEQVLANVPSARVLIRPPAGPPIARIQSIGWAMFQESAAHVGFRPVNTLRVLSLTDEEWVTEQTVGLDRTDVDEGTPDSHLAPPPFPSPPGPGRRLRGGLDHCSYSRLEFRDLNDKVLARSATASTFDIMVEYDAFIGIVRDEHADNSGGRSMVRELTRRSGSTVWVRTRGASLVDRDTPPDDPSGSADDRWRSELPLPDDFGNQDTLS